MAVLDILTYPDTRLKQVSRPVEVVDAAVRRLISDLEETMRAGPPSVGIAAPQAGRFERVIIVDVSSRKGIPNHGRLILINPEITFQDGSVVGREGCLSVPDYTGNVVRAEKITLQALDPTGESRVYD
ncbi:MAG: peptide deformylase, partial [Nitrospinae bacterium]|nr:peptide deformylase [Nitrospinota bacterium]